MVLDLALARFVSVIYLNTQTLAATYPTYT